MKARFLTIFVSFASGLVHADAPEAPKPQQHDSVAAAASARPSDEAIKAAVRAVLEEMPAGAMPTSGTALSGGAYREFARKFSEAEKPHCMGPNALKHQPHSTVAKTVFGDFAVGAGGVFALPFWGAAIMRGKCSWSR